MIPAKDRPCSVPECKDPRHITSGGNVRTMCMRHYTLMVSGQRAADAAAKRREAPTPCKYCGGVVELDHIYSTVCRGCDRANRSRRSMGNKSKGGSKPRVPVDAKPKPRPINYATQRNMKKYLCCKECCKYVPREQAVARFYCSNECRDSNNKRHRRELPSDSMRV